MPDLDPAPTAEVLRQLLTSRFSCRGFRPDPVPEETIEQILSLAQRSPSWCNTQPWQVHLVTGEATDALRAGLRDAVLTQPHQPDIEFPREYAGVYRQRRKDCAVQLYDAVGVANGDREASALQTFANFELFGAPHVAIVTTEEALGTYGAVDCGLWVGTFLLAAESHGVAAIPQAALATCAAFLREFLDLPDTRQVVCGISFGYADTDHPANSFRTPRAGLDEAVTWRRSAALG